VLAVTFPLMLRLSPPLVDMTTSVSGMAICQGLEQFQRDLGAKGPVNLHCSSSFTIVTCKFLIAEAGVLSGLILDLTLCLFTKGSYLLREESLAVCSHYVFLAVVDHPRISEWLMCID